MKINIEYLDFLYERKFKVWSSIGELKVKRANVRVQCCDNMDNTNAFDLLLESKQEELNHINEGIMKYLATHC